ncbi:MAG: hypothetical protein Q9M91_06250 [Candidatus Dojkabacteria bacterium]|nr:hypothetical protein [Candidatus Dojkabacteria bacterium]MDQ7021398.1 hypothetical protein [Candidatus Dojkabacteria bacterium]
MALNDVMQPDDNEGGKEPSLFEIMKEDEFLEEVLAPFLPIIKIENSAQREAANTLTFKKYSTYSVTPS